jgi:hypothetical protein
VTTAKFNEFKGKPRQAQVAGFSQPWGFFSLSVWEGTRILRLNSESQQI